MVEIVDFEKKKKEEMGFTIEDWCNLHKNAFKSRARTRRTRQLKQKKKEGVLGLVAARII
ncbi:hypothetical protein FRX31_008399 [Thalictrum thalictroides]|uniref:Uncharacterized protein n=1 Tax=Thalictrum thalictroides TaxID=46969 RepID=A0A7J6WX55_THATH|nr:hypothetical protein FRX31_008399 [Thalictrum thalictroides]